MDALKRKMEIAAVAFFCTVTALIAAYSCATAAAANLAQQTAAAPATISIHALREEGDKTAGTTC